MPLVMKVFEPLSTHSSPSRTAVVRMPRRSLPAPGSVIATAEIVAPLANPGSQRAFCSGVPRSSRYGRTMSSLIEKPRCSEVAPTAASSSTSTARNR